MNSKEKSSKPVILITGGTGYIGSHTVVALINVGFAPVIVDNLSNSKVSVLERIEKITGKKPPFYNIDLRDSISLSKVFDRHQIYAVIHYAGLKAVGESVDHPLDYYGNNIEGTISLCLAMDKNNVKKMIFSSSAAVYGDSLSVPISEDFPLAPTNPYARTKLMIERILQDMCVADPTWNVIILRYFNPVGAHPSGLMGEDPVGTPSNLVPYISQVAVGRRNFINVFGNDYPTIDGTGVRDYIHVMDLADGHIAALKKMEKTGSKKSLQGPTIVNLGTGQGYSVMEVIAAFAKVSGKTIPYCISKRRSGDVASCYADASLALKLLGWKTENSLADMCTDAWRWQSLNPYGYS